MSPRQSPLKMTDTTAPDVSRVLSDIREGLTGLNAAKFSDVVLKTSDNQTVHACRALLAVRSPFFAKLFFSDFAERDATEVSISLAARPLKNIVEFAYTGESTLVKNILKCVPKGKKDSSLPSTSAFGSPTMYTQTSSSLFTPTNAVPPISLKEKPTPLPRPIRRKEVQDLVGLAAAADYCDIAELRKWCYKSLSSLIVTNKKSACTALEALPVDVADGDIVSREALSNFIASYPEACLLVPDCKALPKACQLNLDDCSGVLELSTKSLNDILKANRDAIVGERQSQGSLWSEYMFQVVYFWGSHGLLLQKQATDKNADEGASRERLWHKVASGHYESEADEKNLEEKVRAIKLEQAGPRWFSAKAMVALLDLTKMRPSFLRDYVEGSGLVQEERLLDAYKQLAMRGEEFLLHIGCVMGANGQYAKAERQPAFRFGG